MYKKRVINLSILLVSILLGIVLALQLKNVQLVGGDVSKQRREELEQNVLRLEQTRKGLEERVYDLERQIAEFEQISVDSGAITQRMRDELAKARLQAGISDVVGPGIILTINHRTIDEPDGSVSLAAKIYDSNLLYILNELNASGAEAISINDERILSKSEIRGVGQQMLINTHSYSAPYVIKAIGKPETLIAAMNIAGGVMEAYAAYFEITLEPQEEVLIKGYRSDDIQFRYAKPASEGSNG